MPILNPVEIYDTFDEWRQKINAAFNEINNLPTITPILDINPPLNNGDILIYNSSSSLFENRLLTTEIQNYLTSQNIIPTSEVEQYFFNTMGGLY